MIRYGATTIPLAGWVVDPGRPEQSRSARLSAVRRLVEGYGLSAVELTTDLSVVYPQVFDAGYYGSVADLQQALGFLCSVHLPFLWVDPSSLNETLREASMECMRWAIGVTQPVEVTTYVLHLWGLTVTQITSVLDRPKERAAILGALMRQAARSLEQMCSYVDPRDLCVENLEDSLFEQALPLLEQSGASICLDVGHLAWQWGGEVDFLALHRHRVREVHLHDALSLQAGTGPQVRDHLPLSAGELDYAAFLHKLDEIGFEGMVILENNNQADLERSLECLQPFLR
jgi:sugar phosphate isomerase/epimerase